jgi:hypothetical protein
MGRSNPQRLSVVGRQERTDSQVIGQEVGPDGDIGYIVSVRTELLRSVDLNDCTLATALKHFDLDQVYMRPAVREFLERIPKQ